MPDLLAHYAVSFLVASRFFRFRVSAVIALLGLLPDVDALLMIHRWITHSFIPVFAFGVIVFIVTARFSRPSLAYVAVALSLYSIHIIMDVFTAPTPVLWPLIGSSYFVNVNVNGILSHDGAALVPAISIESTPPDFTRRLSIEGPIISEYGILVALASATVILAELLALKLRRQA